jgi:hypothetical protein
MENLITRALLPVVLLAFPCLAACGHGGSGDGLPYKEAEHYFLRNDVDGRKVPAAIATRSDFDRCFGMAAVMGGQPTPIDFDRQFVIAVVLPETNHSTTIHPDTLTDEGDALQLEYGVSVSPEENTWTSVPLCLLIVDKRYERGQVVLIRQD